MFSVAEKEIIRHALSLASTYIATPTWKKRAVALHHAFPDGQWEASDLDFILTVAVEGNKPWPTYMRDRDEQERVAALRDRLRVAA
jgi:hypothetical protein